jgi:hypothetical protein
MTERDIELIERALSISLPEEYRRGLCPFPIPGMRGNTEAEVWDDPHGLIAINRGIRADVRDWPSWLFVIGRAEGDPSGYAIDTRSSEGFVWWLDHMQLGPGSGPTEGPFIDWFSQRTADPPTEDSGGRSVLWFMVVWLASSVAVLIAFGLWLARSGHRLRNRNG